MTSKLSSMARTAVTERTEASEPVGIGDELLLERLRGGDAGAGEALVKRYAQPLMRYLQRIAGEALAEELHQQTWLSVLDNLDKFDPACVSRSTPGNPASQVLA